jgi:hypothetical protein
MLMDGISPSSTSTGIVVPGWKQVVRIRIVAIILVAIWEMFKRLQPVLDPKSPLMSYILIIGLPAGWTFIKQVPSLWSRHPHPLVDSQQRGMFVLMLCSVDSFIRLVLSYSSYHFPF